MELDFSEQIKNLFVSKAEKMCPDCDKQMSECSCEDSTVEKSEAGKMCAEHGEPDCEKCSSKMELPTSKSSDGEDPKKEDEEDEDEDEEGEEEGEEEGNSFLNQKAQNKVKAYLEAKIVKHNENNDRQISLNQLKEVFVRGSETFETNHRVGVSKNQWAFARVNSFLKLASEQNVNTSYAKADSDILSLNFDSNNFEFSEFSDIEFQLAKISLIEAGLNQQESNVEIFAKKKVVNKTLNKPFRLPSGSKKKFGVYVKNDKGNTVMVKFGDPNMTIKRDDPERRKSYRARHGCDNPGPKWKANYWSCKMWSKKPVSKITSSECGCKCGSCEDEEITSSEDCGCGCGQCEDVDIEDLVEIEGAKKGLWENIRDKKERMGKNYKPAKPGSKDYPDKEAYKKAQADEYDWDGEEEFNQNDFLSLDPSLAHVEVIED